MFTEYQIRASFIKTLQQALSETEVSGYKVLARNPQVMTWDNNTVLVDKISAVRHGFQSTEYFNKVDWIPETEKFKWRSMREAEVWLEEITYQVSIVHKRLVTDNLDTLTGEDVAKRLIMWLNTRKNAAKMRGRTDVPFAPVHVFQLRPQAYTDDSDIHQVDEQFDFKMIVVQFWDKKIDPVTALDWESHPI